MFGFFKKKLDIEAFMEGAVEGLRLATLAHSETWGLGEEHSWDVSQDDVQITFSFDDGTIASAPAQIIGTLNVHDNTFMWGWNHPSIAPDLQVNAYKVKAFGRKHGLKELTTHKLPCTEERAWKYTALAMRLCEANGAYRGEASPGTFVFMNFGEVRLSKR